MGAALDLGSFVRRVRGLVIGKPRDPLDKGVFEKITLAAVLAWIGLGADGLSSACYGPQEAFLVLGDHYRLSILLVFLTMTTVFLLSRSQLRVVQLFPSGGGGYGVASRLLGPFPGLVSGSALLVDYVLTISVSIAACGDAIFSFIPLSWHFLEMPFELALIGALTLLNLRGIRESVTALMPIFFVFLLTHALAIVYAIASHASGLPDVISDAVVDVRSGIVDPELGWLGLAAIVLRAYAYGGGTYTGIEAIANSVQAFREPRVETAKKTLTYMGISLAIVAGGLLFAYLLYDVRWTEGKTLNAVLFESVAREAPLPSGLSTTIVWVALVSEGALLFVAAQAGFVDGPRVISNMALDSWMPRRFSNLSDRLVMSQGICLFGAVGAACLLLTGGSLSTLVTMYSINVFLTFTLSQLGLLRSDWPRRLEPGVRREIGWVFTTFVAAASLLGLTMWFKFGEGGWITLLVTGVVVLTGLVIRRHYESVKHALADLDVILQQSRPGRMDYPNPPLQPNAPTACLLVGGFSGLGIHSYLWIHRMFPNWFKNFYFLSAGVIGVSEFKGEEEITRLREKTKENLQLYLAMTRAQGLYAEARMSFGTDAVDELMLLCKEIARDHPRVVFFLGKLIFYRENFFTWFLHNHTAEYLQRRLQFEGLQSVILPIRVRSAHELAKPLPAVRRRGMETRRIVEPEETERAAETEKPREREPEEASERDGGRAANGGRNDDGDKDREPNARGAEAAPREARAPGSSKVRDRNRGRRGEKKRS
jgi:hypothetical protein